MSHQSKNHGRVGPNAIIRVYEALDAASGMDSVRKVFVKAGLEHYLETLPEEMVDEREVIALQGALRDELGLAQARPVARDAGRRTGEYLLAKRIPGPAQKLLKLMPARFAARSLLKAIGSNAWTFVGTGTFSADHSYPPRVTIEDSLICRGAETDQPVCDFYAGTFERLFRELVHPDATATETACRAAGAPNCVFEIRW